MEPKTIDALWLASGIVMVIATVVIAAGLVFDLPVPDNVTRVFGIFDILAIGVFTYASVKRNRRA